MAKISYLLPEIIEAILLKSSVKPLLRFKSVSKSWNALISDPVFVRNHHQESISSHSQDLFICFSSGVSLVKLGDQKLEIVQELERPFDCTSFICHYGGVLLLTESWSRRHVLWNPSTRTHQEFWIPSQCRGVLSYGLCHDPITEDFKVVIVEIDNFSVFSCKYKSWIIKRQKFTDPYTDYDPYIRQGLIMDRRGVCVDGAIYWVGSRQNVKKIIYYDPRYDQLKVLHKPEKIKETKTIFLTDLGGFLCLRCEGQDVTTIKLWIKEKGIDNNSWKDFVTIENVENVRMDVFSLQPQCLMGDKIVIRNGDDQKFVVYSPLEKTFEQLGDTELKFYEPGLVRYLDCPFFPVKTTPKSKRKRL